MPPLPSVEPPEHAGGAYRWSEERLRAVLANVTGQLLLLEAVRDAEGAVVDWRYVEASDDALARLGLAREELLGKTAREIAPERIGELHGPWARVLETGASWQYATSYRDREFLVTMFRADDHTIGSAAHDITEQRRAERALRESERLYRSVGESIDYGIWVCTPDGRNVYASESFLRLVGLTQEQCAAFGWSAVLHPDDVDRTLAAWKACVRTGGVWDIEHRFRGVDGRWHPVLARGVPVRDERGEIACWAGINLDIRRLKQAEEALRAADQRKTDFLAVLSHELRDPLAALQSSLVVLDRTPAGSPPAVRAIEVVRRQTDHLTTLVDDLLDISRVNHGKIRLLRSHFDARDVVRRACEDVRAAYAEHRIALTVDLAPGPVWLDADAVRVAQIAGNLLTNALKFTPPGGAVHVSLHPEGDACALRVRDTGVGIDPVMLEQIFEPFAQAERTRDSGRGGLGIGLALVRSLAVVHGGDARARSEGTGRGAEIVVSLPLAPAPAASAAPAQPAAAGRALSVLVIEDHEDAGEVLVELLALEGHEARLAPDGRAGLAALEGWTPDALLCDIGLPDMNGYEVIRQIRQRPAGPSIFAVALTGYAQPEDVQRARESGFDAHLAKPPPLAELRALLAKAAAPR